MWWADRVIPKPGDGSIEPIVRMNAAGVALGGNACTFRGQPKMKSKICIAAMALVMAAPALADDNWSEFRAQSGMYYSTGDYGTSADTSILYLPFTLQYRTAQFQLSGTVPYLQIEGPGNVVGGPDGGGVIVGNGGPVMTESGIGDIVLSATYNLYPDSSSSLPYVELTGKVKIPTADESRGLGTGKTDYTIEMEVFDTFNGVTPFGRVGYVFRGDPDGFDLNDTLYASGGLMFKVNDQVTFGGSYDWREATTDTSDDQQQIVPFAQFRPVHEWSLMAYGVFGLSDASPDAGGGLQITRRF